MFTKDPIRKRGYHRALKAGKLWAVLRKGMNDLNMDMVNRMFEPNPFIKMIGLKDMLEPMEVKIVTGLKPVEKKD